MQTNANICKLLENTNSNFYQDIHTIMEAKMTINGTFITGT